MRVLQFIHSLRRGGAERIAVNLLYGLKALGHEVEIATILDVNEYCDDFPETKDAKSITTPEKYGWPYSILKLADGFRRIAERFSADVVLIHSSTSCIVAADSRLTVPTITVFHGYGDLQRPPSLKATVRKYVDRRAFGKLGGYGVAVSPSLRSSALIHFGCSEENIRCIYNGIDLVQFPYRACKPKGEPVICMVGTLAPEKKVDQAVLAFSCLAKVWPNACLKIFGEGPFRHQLEKLAEDKGLQGSIQFKGRVSEVASHLGECHILWHLSQREGFGLAVAEAMAVGLPVVGVDAPGTRDIVRNGETGFLVPADDPEAVAKSTALIFADSDRFQQFSKAGRARVEQLFDNVRMISNYEKILKERLNGV